MKELEQSVFGDNPVVFSLPDCRQNMKSTKELRGRLAIILYDSPETYLQNRSLHESIDASATQDPGVMEDFGMMVVMNFRPLLAQMDENVHDLVMEKAMEQLQEYERKYKIQLYIDQPGSIAEHYKLDQSLSQVIVLDENGVNIMHIQGGLEGDQLGTFLKSLNEHRMAFRARKKARLDQVVGQ